MAFDKGPERGGIGFVQVEEMSSPGRGLQRRWLAAGTGSMRDEEAGREWARRPGKEASSCGTEGL